MNRENAEKITETYDKLLSECYRLARENRGELMGKSQWLRNAIAPSDFGLYASEDGILCEGMAYTTQTMGNEWFSFVIPYDRIRL